MRDLSRGRHTQALERAAAGPLHKLLSRNLRFEMSWGNDAVSQVVDLLLPAAVGNGQRAGPPEKFDRELGESGLRKVGVVAGDLGAFKVARPQRSVGFQAAQDLLDGLGGYGRKVPVSRSSSTI